MIQHLLFVQTAIGKTAARQDEEEDNSNFVCEVCYLSRRVVLGLGLERNSELSSLCFDYCSCLSALR